MVLMKKKERIKTKKYSNGKKKKKKNIGGVLSQGRIVECNLRDRVL